MGIAGETMESETAAKKWVIAGIQFMSPLKPIYTKKEIEKPREKENRNEEEEDDEERECCRTPKTPESRIPELMKCPGAPRKRKAVSRSNCNGVRDYFIPSDLESVFIRCVERA